MPVFEKPPLETLTPANERWTPLYLEHGRLEVDDSSVKWIGADRTVFRIPVATVSVLMLGPGTTLTHAAVKACSDSNTPVCWVGQDGMRFYAFGTTLTHDNERALHQAAAHTSKTKRAEVARRMFVKRFPDVDVMNKGVEELRGMEGELGILCRAPAFRRPAQGVPSRGGPNRVPGHRDDRTGRGIAHHDDRRLQRRGLAHVRAWSES